jgi:hypothetical protein
MQDDYEHNFLKDELNFILQHSKIDRDARLESNENMKEAIMSLHSLFKMPNRLVTLLYNYQNSYEKVLPSVELFLKLELKSLPKHFKYVYLRGMKPHYQI